MIVAGYLKIGQRALKREVDRLNTAGPTPAPWDKNDFYLRGVRRRRRSSGDETDRSSGSRQGRQGRNVRQGSNGR